MLGTCLQMWSQLCGMNIMMYISLLVTIDHLIQHFGNISTILSTSSKVPVLRDAVVTSFSSELCIIL